MSQTHFQGPPGSAIGAEADRYLIGSGNLPSVSLVKAGLQGQV